MVVILGLLLGLVLFSPVDGTGHLTGCNILLDFDHCFQIVDVHPIHLLVGESGSESESWTQLRGFSGEGWTPEKDIQAFASILFEILFGRLPEGEVYVPTGIPFFVSRIIESQLSPFSRIDHSFSTFLDILKQNDFMIEDSIDSAEVSTFVSWVESAEYLGK